MRSSFGARPLPGGPHLEELDSFDNMRGIGTEDLGRRRPRGSSAGSLRRHYARMDGDVPAQGLKPGTAKYIAYVKENLPGCA